MSAALTLRTVAAGGAKPEFEHPRIRQRRAVQSDPGSPSPRAREINERPINRYQLTWKEASLGMRMLIVDLWKRASGCALPMNYTPVGKTDTDVEEVFFVPKSLRMRRAGPTTHAIEFEVEGRH